MIAAYLATLDAALRFDHALADAVRQEVEDHLREAAAAEPGGAGPEAECRAVARFGDPHALAAQFAALALDRQARRLGLFVLLAVAAALVAMKGRIAWYGIAPFPLADAWRGAAGIVATVDQIAFWAAVAIGAGTWGVVVRGRRAAGTGRRRLRGIIGLGAATTVALAVSVLCDTLLTAWRVPAEPSIAFIIPALSIAVELVCVGALLRPLCRIAARASAARTLLV